MDRNIAKKALYVEASKNDTDNSKIVDKIYDDFEATIKEKDNEIARLRNQLANNHHIECGCSFCKPMTGFVYGDPNVH